MIILVNILLCAFTMTSIEGADQFYQSSGSSFSSGGGNSNSVFQTNGNSVVISRRMGPNNEEQEFISVSNPDVKIEGDYCKLIYKYFR